MGACCSMGTIVGPEPMRPEYWESFLEMYDVKSGRTIADHFPFYLRPEHFDTLLVCRDGERVVTHVGFMEKRASYFSHRLNIGLVGAVRTLEAYRGRGLATQTLKEAFRLHRERGGHFLMISGDRGLYLRNGACSVGSFPQFVIDREAWGDMDAPRVEVRDCVLGDAPVLNGMYRLKPIHFVRPLEEWELALEHARRFADPSPIWRVTRTELAEERAPAGERPFPFQLVTRRRRPAAYLFLNTAAGEKKNEWSVVEWGGSVEDALAALRILAERAGYPRISFTLYPHEKELSGRLLNAQARPQPPWAMKGVIRVTNFAALMEALRGYFTEIVGEKDAGALAFAELPGERFRIGSGSEELVIGDPGTLADALFGRGPSALAASEIPERLRDVLGRLLPLPALRYDLTYA